jgi:hypothetical protein
VEITSIEDETEQKYNSADEIAVWAFCRWESSKDTDTSVILGTA